MFDVGFLELVLLALMGLLILGPKRLPKVAAQLGRWVGQARRMSRTLMYQLRQEVDLDDPRPFSARRPAKPASTKANTTHQQAGSDKKDAGSDEKDAESDKKDAESDETVTPATDGDEQDKPSE